MIRWKLFLFPCPSLPTHAEVCYIIEVSKLTEHQCSYDSFQSSWATYLWTRYLGVYVHASLITGKPQEQFRRVDVARESQFGHILVCSRLWLPFWRLCRLGKWRIDLNFWKQWWGTILFRANTLLHVMNNKFSNVQGI